MVKVALLGAKGALGKAVSDRLSGNDTLNVCLVVREKAAVSKDKVYWDYKSELPGRLSDADVVINCARSDNFLDNIVFNKLLLDQLSSKARLILLSSNAIFARPHGRITQLLFKGDAYIREKKCIERLAKRRPHTVLLRPTVVIDEGNWLDFFSACHAANRVIAPCGGEMSRIKVTTRSIVAKLIEKIVCETPEIPLEIIDKVIPVKDVVRSQISFSASGHDYFNSYLKDGLVTLLNSRVLPDRLVFKLQYALLNKKRPPRNRDLNSELSIEGMTRLYLFGAHTK